MFNNNLKEEYISYKESITSLPEQFLLRLFRKTESFEERLDKDVCNFTSGEILEMYKSFNVANRDILSNFNSALSQYTDWCADNKNMVDDCINHFREVTVEEYSNCINKIVKDKKILSESQVEGIIKKLENPSDKFIVRALWEGVRGVNYGDFLNLDIHDFDTNKMLLNLPERTIEMSERLYDLALESVRTFEYSGANGNGKAYKLFGEHLIIKRMPQSSDTEDPLTTGRRIYIRLKKWFATNGVDSWMSINSIVESGKIEWIKRKCQQYNVTADEFFKPGSTYNKELKNQYSTSAADYNWYTKYRDYL